MKIALLLILLWAAPAVAEEAAGVTGLQHFALAKLLAADGKVTQAVEQFDKAVESDPEAVYLRLEYADFLLAFNRAKQAGEQIEVALSLAQRSVDVLRTYGQVQMALARRDPKAASRAIDALEVLREEDPTDLQGMLLLAQLYQGAGRTKESVDVIEALVRHHTDNQRLKRFLYDALSEAGEKERAQAVLEEVLRAEQRSLENRVSLAQIESDKGNHGAAIELLEGMGDPAAQDAQLRAFLAQEYLNRANSPRISSQRRSADLERSLEILDDIARPSSSTDLQMLRVRVLVARQDNHAAIDTLQDLVARRPKEPRPAELLARVLEIDGQYREAASVVQELIGSRDDPNDRRRFTQNLVRLEARLENWQRVVELAEEARKEDDDDAFSELALGWQIEGLRELGRLEKALAVLRRAEKDAGATANLLLKRAEILTDLDRHEQALAVLHHQDLVANEEPGVAFRRADLLLELERTEAAVELVSRAVAGGEFELLVGGAEFYLRRQMFEQSIPLVRRALESDKAQADDDVSADLHFYLGQAYERSGKASEAAGHFRTVLKLRDDDTNAMNYLGYMWADNGEHLEEALTLVENAVAIEPENGAFQDSLGWAQYRLGHFDDARRSLERAAELTPDNATIFEHLGDVYFALGDDDRARQAYEQAVSLNDEENLEQVRGKLDRLPGGSQ